MMTVLAKDLLLEAEETVGTGILAQLLSKNNNRFDIASLGTVAQVPKHIADLVVDICEIGTPDCIHLQRRLGRRTLRTLSQQYPSYFGKRACASELLEDIGAEVLAAMMEAFPDAPCFEFYTRPLRGSGIEIIFRSKLPLQHYCYGMIEACLEQFQDDALIHMEDLHPATGAHACFEIRPITAH